MTNYLFIPKEIFLKDNKNFLHILDVECNEKNYKCFLNKKKERTNDNIDNDDTNYITNDNGIEKKETPEKKELKNTLYIGCEDGSIKVIEISKDSFIKKFFG